MSAYEHLQQPFAVLKAQPDEYFRLIPQAGVKHVLAEWAPTHNAVWDMNISPQGRVFLSICGESYISEYARLYEFDYAAGKLIHHFNLEEKIMLQERTIRSSKLHTAISFMEDGRIIAASHTTSPSPLHPLWMPYEYANHQWEGYPGSNVFIYDCDTGDFRDCGVISPYDTMYGMTYEPKNGDYFGITWMRGEGYVYNVRDGSHRSLGQLSDSHTSRTFLCSDGHIYGSTYSGAMFRYNTDLREAEFLGVDCGGLLRHAVEREGFLYFTTGPSAVAGRGLMLYRYHLSSRRLDEVGPPVPPLERTSEDPTVFQNAYGLAMDSAGRLWYGCILNTPQTKFSGSRLYMWDLLHGGEPVDLGFLGSEKRTVSCTAEMKIHNDVLYCSDGNHVSWEDGCSGVLAIDLKAFVPALGKAERPFSRDFINYLSFPRDCAKYYPGADFDSLAEKYAGYYRQMLEYQRFNRDNWFRKPCRATGLSFWQTTGRGSAAVRWVEWQDDAHLTVWCGGEKSFRIEASLDSAGNAKTDRIAECPAPGFDALKVPVPAGTELPYMAGRQYLAAPECSEKLPDGSVLVGTRDMMLALIRDGKAFSLGAVTPCGGVHMLSAAPDGTVYGCAGYPRGAGNLFSFDRERGIRQLGYAPEAAAENGRLVAIYHPTAVAVSPSGKYLAVGGSDEIAGVCVIDLQAGF